MTDCVVIILFVVRRYQFGWVVSDLYTHDGTPGRVCSDGGAPFGRAHGFGSSSPAALPRPSGLWR